MNQSSQEFVLCSKYIQGDGARVEGFVLSTIILFGSLTLLGVLRRRISSGILTCVVLVVYTVVSQAIPYLMGLMKSSLLSHQLFPLWASMLLFAYGGTDNMSAYSLDESPSTSTFLWGFIIQFTWLSLILFKITDLSFLLPLIFLISLMFLKVAERGMAISFASKKSALESVTMRLADYMKTEHELAQASAPVIDPNPVTMQGYNYIVDITDVKVEDHKITDKITLEQIWECQGPLLSSTGGDPDGLLKDTCLSISLFWLLLRKFAGYPLHESELDKTWKFASSRLLSNQEDDDGVEKAFRVIEVELNFLYDYFYTKYFFYYYNKHNVKVFHMILVLSFASLTMYNLRDRYQSFDVAVLFTLLMVATIVLLEIVELCYLVTSRWFKVTLVCYYVKEKVWQKQKKQDYYIEKAIEIICTALPSSVTLVRPWQRKLSQYSLLDSYKRVRNDFASRMLYLNLNIPITKMSRKVDSVELTPAVIKAVFKTLKKNGPRLLTNGITSLVENNAEVLSWACRFEMTADLVLAWHVATTLCEFGSEGKSQSESTKTNAEVAAKLSKYCAYLVSTAPILLPGHAYSSKYIYNYVVLDAKRLFRECKSLGDVYSELVVKGMGSREEENARKVLRSGAAIAQHMISDIREQERMWKVLAEFWAELILFLAPSDEAMAHAEFLAGGGEFITHLWALLVHAGILSRKEHNAEMPAIRGSGVYRRSNTA